MASLPCEVISSPFLSMMQNNKFGLTEQGYKGPLFFADGVGGCGLVRAVEMGWDLGFRTACCCAQR